MKLLVGVPTVDMVHNRFAECLANLTAKLARDGIDFELWMQRRTMVYKARDLIADRAAAGGFSHVLWLDADMTFEADAFDRLYAAMVESGADVVCGLYRSRHGGQKLLWWSSLKPPVIGERMPAERVFEIAGAGFGCVLTTAKILADVRNNTMSAFQPFADLGEDLSFCWRALERGAKIVATRDVDLGHVGFAEVGIDGSVRMM